MKQRKGLGEFFLVVLAAALCMPFQSVSCKKKTNKKSQKLYMSQLQPGMQTYLLNLESAFSSLMCSFDKNATSAPVDFKQAIHEAKAAFDNYWTALKNGVTEKEHDRLSNALQKASQRLEGCKRKYGIQ